MFSIQTILLFLYPLILNNTCLELKISKQKYSSSDKFLKWRIRNDCEQTKYYLIGIQIKTDSGWRIVNSYVHALTQKDFKALLPVKPNSKISDSVNIDEIKKEKLFRNIAKEYTEYRLTLQQYDKKDFFAEQSSVPIYGYFEITN